MYNLIILLLLISAGILLVSGYNNHRKGRIAAGAGVVVFTAAFFWFLDFWAEMLWFEALGYDRRFWTIVFSQAGFAIASAAVGALVVYLLMFSVPREKRQVKFFAAAFSGVISGVWGYSNWDIFLKYWYRVSTALEDPVLNENTSFYLFTLPFFDTLYELFILLAVIALMATFLALFFRLRGDNLEIQPPDILEGSGAKISRSLYVIAAALIFILAWGKYLSRFDLMYSSWGAVTGPGWTDVNIRLPAYNIVIVITFLTGVAILIPAVRNWFRNLLQRRNVHPRRFHLSLFSAVGGIIIALWFVALTIIPSLFQWLRVEPNEITYEKPYIANNIRFTRHGFNLQKLEEREFPAEDQFTEKTVEENPNIFSNIRLWDWRALDAVYKQFQEIRLYYEFTDVDIDRYTYNNMYRQVMISAREMELSNLPEQSQTFVNKRFKYTHGYGLTLTSVSEFTPEGLPNLLIKDIPPKSTYPELKVEQPQIYYGELTDSYVVVNTEEEEFDYPSGEENVYIRYPGNGGVSMGNLWRKFLFGWKFDGTRFFLSGYPSEGSRIMYHRQIQERVKKLAPFLHFDTDPYIVLANGQLYWIIDGYTTSTYFPYSEPFYSRETIEYGEGTDQRSVSSLVSGYLNGVNYLRNSVKVVVNAFHGNVDFYIFDEKDLLIRVWDNIFPGLFKDKDEMPEKLLKHVRYPVDFLLAQGLVYAKYHMNDPAVFYNQEDLWVRATEKYYTQVQPVQPYYVMWELPDSDHPEFVLILPFTPKNRQVLIGWIAGMCDPQNYGRFLAYKFPKEKRILGPQQVETKIDQDRFLSGQLTLWDQRGSNVIRGNVLAIPIGETLIYVEPIYLQAETAAYPELRLVAVMHNDNLSYAETFGKALSGLFGETRPEVPAGETALAESVSLNKLIEKANSAFEDYLKLQGEKRFKEAAEAMESLKNTLQQLSEYTASDKKQSKSQSQKP